jgi:hypothetical protein
VKLATIGDLAQPKIHSVTRRPVLRAAALFNTDGVSCLRRRMRRFNCTWLRNRSRSFAPPVTAISVRVPFNTPAIRHPHPNAIAASSRLIYLLPQRLLQSALRTSPAALLPRDMRWVSCPNVHQAPGLLRWIRCWCTYLGIQETPQNTLLETGKAMTHLPWLEFLVFGCAHSE